MVSSSGTISASFVTKRSRSPEPPPYKKLTLRVKNQQGEEDIYKIGNNAQLKKLMATYCQKKSFDYRSVRFVFEEKWINPRQTPSQLLMQENDEICVVTEQGGGGPYTA